MGQVVSFLKLMTVREDGRDQSRIANAQRVTLRL
jgi:hypothetical protein